jgi:hypothetical protein
MFNIYPTIVVIIKVKVNIGKATAGTKTCRTESTFSQTNQITPAGLVFVSPSELIATLSV